MSEELITESWIINQKNFELNLDKWDKGNPLWITGASGDGKSTLAKKMAEENNAKVIIGDIVLCRLGWTEEKWKTRIKSFDKDTIEFDFINKHPDMPFDCRTFVSKTIRTWDHDRISPWMTKFFKFVMKECKDNPKYNKTKYVVESCEICYLDPKIMVNKPLIVMGTSRLEALKRRINRDMQDDSKNENLLKLIFKYLKKYNTNNRRIDDSKDLFLKNIKELTKENTDDIITEEVEEKEEDLEMNTVVFDLGNVLVTSIDYKKAIKEEQSIPKQYYDMYIKTYQKLIKIDKIETATIDDAKRIFKNLLPKTECKPWCDKVFNILSTCWQVAEYTDNTLATLKDKGYRLYYLSNWNKSSFELTRFKGIFNFLNQFDGGIISYEVGYKKPDEKIYKLLLEKFKLNAKQIIFFDDMSANITAAKKLGMTALIFDKKIPENYISKLPEVAPDQSVKIKDNSKDAPSEDENPFTSVNPDNELLNQTELPQTDIPSTTTEPSVIDNGNLIDPSILDSDDPFANIDIDNSEFETNSDITDGNIITENTVDSELYYDVENAKIFCEINSVPNSIKELYEEVISESTDVNKSRKFVNEVKILAEKCNLNFYIIEEDLITEATDKAVKSAAPHSHIIIDELYPKINKVLSTPAGHKKFMYLVGQYIDRNSEMLHKIGPVKMIPFGDLDKKQYFTLFDVDDKDVKDMIKRITKSISSSGQFKLLTNNPIFAVFYCCIRYYSLKGDEKGLNSALAIYALSNYPSVFHLIFPYGANEETMQYTIDHLSKKFNIVKGGNLFGGLFLSIQSSYAFLQPFMKDASDGEVIRFIQRIRNDQKSMMKHIMDNYMKNYNQGLKVTSARDTFDGVVIDFDKENNTSAVETISQNITNNIITSGLDLKRVNQCKNLAQIGMSDARFYLSKIVSDKYTNDIANFIRSILFLYLYTDHHDSKDINSSNFLVWSADLFRKTNSNDPNIDNIKKTLDKWAEESGVHKKFKREASRINYKKAIFWYFILTIQYYNN